MLRRGNSSWRKELRRRDKTKAGIAAKVLLARDQKHRRIVKNGDDYLGKMPIVPGDWPRVWIDGLRMPIVQPHHQRNKSTDSF